MIDAAIMGSTRKLGRLTIPSVARASVMECATVKHEMMPTIDRKLLQTKSRPKRNRRWSYPVQMWAMPRCRKPQKVGGGSCWASAAPGEGADEERESIETG